MPEPFYYNSREIARGCAKQGDRLAWRNTIRKAKIQAPASEIKFG